jgi:hypothetical protein
MKDFTRVCRIEPQAVGAWLKQTSVKSNFQHVVYTIFFRRPQKKNANIRHPFKLQILFDRAADKIIMPLRGDRHFQTTTVKYGTFHTVFL